MYYRTIIGTGGNVMEVKFKIVHYERKTENLYPVQKFGFEHGKKVQHFHASFPGYKETPLANLTFLAEQLGIKHLFVKDESFRFGLNAFKVLGGSYALGNYIANKLNMNIDELTFEMMTSKAIKDQLEEITFVTTTDGNHGRGIAWTAKQLHQKSVVYMPRGSAKERLENILAEGSDACITDLNYDDAVRLANENAKKYGWVIVQDTAWEGYEEIPTWIMQGYTTMVYESILQMRAQEIQRPTHVFVQAGVGAMSGAVAAYIADLFGADNRPIVTVVEPDKANCIYRTAEADDGKLHFVTENMDTIMAGLACGEPCTIGWNILHDHADNFVSCPDFVVAKGMRVLGNPLNGDTRVISGESGAVTLGFVAEVMQNNELEYMRKILKLDEDSCVLCISTEGDTDRENYRRIVWDGKYPSY